MGLSNYPPGVDDNHPHFHGPDWPETCPGCGEDVGDEPICPLCGYRLDPDEAAAIERDQDYDRQFDMERETGL